MSDNLQLTIFDSEPVIPPLTYYRAASPANRTALQESVWRLVMNVTSGERCGESFANFAPDGSLLKMSSDCFQVSMDGSLPAFSGTFPTWGILSDGVCCRLPPWEPCTGASGSQLLPTPTANLWRGYNAAMALRFRGKMTASRPSGCRVSQYLNDCPAFLPWYRKGTTNLLNPLLLEQMMGFPARWTETKRSEMP